MELLFHIFNKSLIWDRKTTLSPTNNKTTTVWILFEWCNDLMKASYFSLVYPIKLQGKAFWLSCSFRSTLSSDLGLDSFESSFYNGKYDLFWNINFVFLIFQVQNKNQLQRQTCVKTTKERHLLLKISNRTFTT